MDSNDTMSSLGSSSSSKALLPDHVLAGQEIIQFADINADMFTDIITVDAERKIIIIHIFDASSGNFT